jgi:hypothetical protein
MHISAIVRLEAVHDRSLALPIRRTKNLMPWDIVRCRQICSDLLSIWGSRFPIRFTMCTARCQFFVLSCTSFLVHQSGYRIRFLTKNVVITAYLGSTLSDERCHGRYPENRPSASFVRRPSASTWGHSVKSWRAGAPFAADAAID